MIGVPPFHWLISAGLHSVREVPSERLGDSIEFTGRNESAENEGRNAFHTGGERTRTSRAPNINIKLCITAVSPWRPSTGRMNACPTRLSSLLSVGGGNTIVYSIVYYIVNNVESYCTFGLDCI